MVDWVDTSKINADYVPAVYGAADVAEPNLQCFDFWGRIRTSNVYAIGALGTEISATDAKGQSFKANSDFYLTAIQFPIAAGSVAQDLIVRVGDTADLSTTYLAEYQSSVIGEAGKLATVTTDRKLKLTRDTQYYMGILKTQADAFFISVNLSDIYAEGVFLSTNSGWAMTEVPAYDLNFIIWGSAIGK